MAKRPAARGLRKPRQSASRIEFSKSAVDLHARVRAADFRPDVLDEAQSLERTSDSLGPPRNIDFLRGRAAIAEVYDYFGKYAEAKASIEELGAQSCQVLARETPQTVGPDTWKRHVWIVLAYAHTFYRDANYGRCRSLLIGCERAVERLDGSEQGSFGTRARLAYAHGQVLRQTQEFEAAKVAFFAAIQWAYRRIKLRLHDDTSESERARHAALANLTVAKSMALGLGWIHYNVGQLSFAAPLVEAGSVMLAGTHDELHEAYARLLSGSIARARAGERREDLRKALGVLRDVNSAFTKARHSRYQTRSALELAVTYFHLDELTPALQMLSEGTRIATTQGDQRWLCNGRILQSRILRKMHRLEEALAIALEVADQADVTYEVASRAEALMAAAEVEIELARSKGEETTALLRHVGNAMTYLERAQSLSVGNAKSVAMCHLHRATCALLQSDIATARSEGAQVEALQPVVESGFVRDRLAALKARLASGDFVISAGDTSQLDYEHWRKKLVEFLLRQATSVSPNKIQIARLLGVSRPTLDRWLNTSEESQEDRNRRAKQ